MKIYIKKDVKKINDFLKFKNMYIKSCSQIF